MGEIVSKNEVLGNEVAEGAGEDLVDAEEESQLVSSLPSPTCLHSPNVTTMTLRMPCTGVGAGIVSREEVLKWVTGLVMTIPSEELQWWVFTICS